MIESIRTFADCRTPSLENSLFELCFSMPPKYKANWETYKTAINILSPALMKVRNANTGVRASYSQPVQSAILLSRAALNRFLGTRFRLPPTGRERSWILPAEHINENAGLRQKICALASSDYIASLGFVDMNGVRRAVEEHDRGDRDHASLLLLLVGMDRLLRN